MHPCKTGDQSYNDASPNGECSLVRVSFFGLLFEGNELN